MNNRFLCHFDDIVYLLIALVTYGEPTPSKCFMHDVGTPNEADLVNKWQMHGNIPPLSVFSCPLFLQLPKSR